MHHLLNLSPIRDRRSCDWLSPSLLGGDRGDCGWRRNDGSNLGFRILRGYVLNRAVGVHIQSAAASVDKAVSDLFAGHKPRALEGALVCAVVRAVALLLLVESVHLSFPQSLLP